MKSRPSLFEVINKAPQSAAARPFGARPWFRRGSGRKDGLPLVAEALTEEEAAAELAARQAAKEEAARAKRARIEARRARKAARRAARAAARQAGALSATGPGGPPANPVPFRLTPGRLELSLSTTACIAVAAGLCLLAIGSYALGHRAGLRGERTQLAQVAAVKNGGQPAEDAIGVLTGEGNAAPAESAARATPTSRHDADLSELLKPPAREMTVMANQPVRVEADDAPGTAEASRLNYLHIETFRITRDKGREALRRELEDVRAFLRERGIETFARAHSKGFYLYSRQGFPPSRDSRAQREAFQSRVEELGREYRRSGGLYLFKGCYFVNYAHTRAGKPV